MSCIIILLTIFFPTGEQYKKFYSLINDKHGTNEVATNMRGLCCNSFVTKNAELYIQEEIITGL